MHEHTAALDRALERALTGASPARARQLRWVARELADAAAAGAITDPAAPLADPAAAAAYLDAARTGQLRSRAWRRADSTDASARVRLACLRRLCRAAGMPPVPVPTPPPPPAGWRAPHTHQSLLRGWLARQAAEAVGQRAKHARDAAALAVALDAPVRIGPLADLRLADVDLHAGAVTFTVAPPGLGVQPERQHHALSAATVALVRNWLRHRDGLAAARVDHLWVSVSGNHRGDGVRTPPGMPLRVRGLGRAVEAALAAANLDLAGTPGWTPVPTHLEAVRLVEDQEATPTLPAATR